MNLYVQQVTQFLNNEAKGTKVIGATSLQDMVNKLKTPRKIMMLVKGKWIAYLCRSISPFSFIKLIENSFWSHLKHLRDWQMFFFRWKCYLIRNTLTINVQFQVFVLNNKLCELQGQRLFLVTFFWAFVFLSYRAWRVLFGAVRVSVKVDFFYHSLIDYCWCHIEWL